jgi:hypothetical protein
LRPKTELAGLILGLLSMLLFWLGPIGFFIGIAGGAMTLSRKKERLRFFVAALTTSALGIVFFVAFWSTIWVLSQ